MGREGVEIWDKFGVVGVEWDSLENFSKVLFSVTLKRYVNLQDSIKHNPPGEAGGIVAVTRANGSRGLSVEPAKKNIFRFNVFFDALATAFASESAGFHTAEGHFAVGEDDFVHAHQTKLQGV